MKGYVGPQHGLVTYYADTRISAGTSWVTGANKPDHHVLHVTAGRDFTVERYLDVATIAEGDPCPRCGHELVIGRAIEIGHIFQLGRKYAERFRARRARPRRHPGARHHGLVRHRGQPRGRVDHRAEPRRPRPDLAARPWLPPTSTSSRSARPASRRRPSSSASPSSAPACACCSTTAAPAPGWPSPTPTCWACRPSSWSARAFAGGEIEVKDRRSGERRTIALERGRRAAGGEPAVAGLKAARVGWSDGGHRRTDPYQGDVQRCMSTPTRRERAYGEEAAEALGIDPARMYKTLVVDGGGRLAVGVVPVAGLARPEGDGGRAGDQERAHGRRRRRRTRDRLRRRRDQPAGSAQAAADGHRRRASMTWPTVFVSAGRRGLQVELRAGGARLAHPRHARAHRAAGMTADDGR